MVTQCLDRCLNSGRQRCSSLCTPHCARSFVLRLFPFLRILRDYSFRYDFSRDLVAGLTVGVMQVPQGLAYALLAGLPPVYGLYTSLYPPLIYFLLGSSRHLSVGTFAVVSLMVGEVVKEGVAAWQLQHLHNPCDPSDLSQPLHNGTNASVAESLRQVKVTYAMSATFGAGLFQLLLGVTGAGRVASFMSDSLVSGFTMGAALHVLPSQLHAIFGLPFVQHVGIFKLIYECRDFVLGIPHTQWVTLVTSLVAMVILVVVREGVNNNKKTFPHLPVPVPIELALIITGTVVSHYMGFAPKYNVQTIGLIPKGLPAPQVGVLRALPRVLSKALVLAVVAFSLSFATARILAEKHAYDVDANQELAACGVANVLCPLLACFCCSGSLSRSMVLDEVGGKTQVTGLVSSSLVLVILLFVGPLFHTLPNCVLAVIVVVSLKRLYLQCCLLPRFWRISKTDFAVWLVVFWATVILDVDIGLLLGLIFSLFSILFKTQKPYSCLLGRIGDTEMYADVNGPTKVREVPGVKIFRFEAAVYFGNAANFKNCLQGVTGLCPHDVRQRRQSEREKAQPDLQQKVQGQQTSLKTTTFTDYQTLTSQAPAEQVKVIVVDGSILQTLDSLTVATLTQIIQDYTEAGIGVFLAGCKPTVLARLEASGFYDHVGRDHVCDTIHQAVCQAAKYTQSSSLPAEQCEHCDTP